MSVNEKLLAPCGLYCGVCSIRVAFVDDNAKLKGKLAEAYGVPTEQIACEGCSSDQAFVYCRFYPIRDCATERKLEGCHQCDDFPCERIDSFPFPVGKRVILRAVPQRREMGTERWVAAETQRYRCPACGTPIFRGANRCPSCKEPVSLD